MSENRTAAVPETLVGILDEAAARRPDAPAHRFLPDRGSGETATSFGALVERSQRVAGAVASRVPTGRPVLVVSPASPLFLPALAGCFRTGSPAVPLPPPRPGMEPDGVAFLSRVAVQCDAGLVLAPAAVVPTLRIHGLHGRDGRPLGILALEETVADGPTPAVQAQAGPSADTPALLLFTSGSTGSPKGVVLTHGNLVGNIREFVRAAGLGADDPMVTWLPNGHIAGLYTRLLGWFTGAETVEFPATVFLEKPSFWPRTIARFRAAISAAPNFAYDLVASVPDSELEGVRLDRWRFAISGGEVVRASTLRQLAARLGPLGFAPSALTPYYGLTETLCSAVRLASDPGRVRLTRAGLERNLAEDAPDAAADALEFLSNGPALGSTRVAVVDPATRTGLPGDRVGEVWVQGPAVTPGYLGQEALNAEVVRAVRADAAAGTWFRTGDLGFLRGGDLYITGRLKEMIVVRGKNCYPADLEQAVSAAVRGAGVGAVAAFGLEVAGEEQVALALELARGVDPASADPAALSAAAQAALVRACGVACGAVTVVPAGGLPRTPTGKIQRGQCRVRLEGGAWKAVGTDVAPGAPEASSAVLEGLDPSAREVAGWLRAEVATVLARPASQVDPSLGLPALGVDSLGMVRLLAATEIRFATGLGLGAMLTAPSLVELARILDRRRRGAVDDVAAERVDWTAEGEGFGRVLRNLPQARVKGRVGSVFVTGATGFLGAYLVREILARPEVVVRCLVRGADAADGRRRLLRKLESIPGWDPARAPGVEVVHGSLEEERFGLSPEAFRALAESSDVVLHNGANVNFVAPYPLLRAANVTSNLGILALAVAGGGTPVHYVSTTAVFNGPDRDRLARLDEDAFLPTPDTLFSGYAQTKWVAEALWRDASASGLPVALHRPGLVTGDSGTGVWHTDDFLCRLFKGCLQMGVFPDLEVEVDMIPVDLVARGIADAVLDPGSVGRGYHWSHPEPARMREIAGWFDAGGWEAAVVPVGDWLRRLRAVDGSNALYPLMPFLLQRVGPDSGSILEFFGGRRLNLGRTNALGRLARAGLSCPDPVRGLLPLYARHLVGSGFLPAPTRPASTSPIPS